MTRGDWAPSTATFSTCKSSGKRRDLDENLVELYWVTGQPRRESPTLSDDAAIHERITGADP
jgi:hypothetical protein